MAAQIRDDLAYTLYLMTAAKPEWHELFRQHYFTGPDYAELAEELALPYIGIRMKIGRCLEEARSLVS